MRNLERLDRRLRGEGISERMMLTADDSSSNDSSSSSGASKAKMAGKIASAMGQAGADSERQSYEDDMTAARLGTMKDAPKPDRYDVLPTNIPSYKRGGTMKHRGVAKLHRGERAKGRKSKGR